jgi:LysM repeat protein/ABC-type branched-subunit amino acid transport system substrate-binding protein
MKTLKKISDFFDQRSKVKGQRFFTINLLPLTRQLATTCLVIFILNSASVSAQTTTSVSVKISERIENVDGKYYHLHTVEKGQTMYSISRAYQVTADQIKRTVKDKLEIQIGETLLIPANTQRIPQQKTNFSVDNSNQKPIADTSRKVFSNPPKTTLNVALMLPLYLNEVNQIRINPRNTNRIAIKPFSFITFYQGANLAAQAFEDETIKINVHVFDITEDENTAINLINSNRLNHVDVVIGPLFARSFRVMSDFAKQREIFIINPLSDRDDILDDNPFVIKVNTSEKNQLQTLLDYVASKHIEQRILILSNDSLPNEKERSEQAQQFFENSENKFDDVIFIDISKDRFSRLNSNLSNTKGNAIVYLANNEAFFTQIATQISKRNFTNVLYCSQKIPQLELTDLLYLNDLQTHYIEPFFIDYDDANVRNFERLFFETYRTVPDNHAYRGYDVMSYVFQLLKIGNTNYGNFLETMPFSGFHNTIQLYRSNPLQGLENRNTNILKIENSQLRKANN